MTADRRDPAAVLKEDLDATVRFLESERLVTVGDAERDAALRRADRLREKAGEIEKATLLVGLLGGTGVGKSSLMNALAGSDIASASHRRPHTEDILIYRYEGTSVPLSLPLSGTPFREYVHKAAPAGQILLCDLPDFDSVREEHREKVLRFLEHLDVLFWVTSPEKYGDGRFYDFLRLAGRARENFYFVLNKADLFFQGEPDGDGYGRMGRALELFRGHLEKSGIADPAVYVLSAGEILAGKAASPWNRFSDFRRRVFEERSLKEVREIKAANLYAELGALREVLDRERSVLERMERRLGEYLTGIPSKREAWREEFGTSLAAALGNREWRDLLRERIPARRLLVGPGYGIASAVEEWERIRRVGRPPGERADAAWFREVERAFEHHAGRVRREWKAVALRENLPLEEAGFPGPGASGDGEGSVVGDFVLAALDRIRPPGAFLFRSFQVFLYGIVLAAFLAALAGGGLPPLPPQGGLAEWLRVPGILIASFFSPRGLAALGSLMAVFGILGWRSYIRAGKVIYGMVSSWSGRIGNEIVSLAESKVDASIGELEEFRGNLSRRAGALREFRDRKD
jgi:GTP-binding protein EngB required for normal cell division